VFLAMRPQVSAAQSRADAATDRLLSAWREGVQLPTLDDDEPHTIEAPDPLVADWLDQFDETGQAFYGRRAAMMARQGLDAPTIVLSLQRLRERGGEVIE